MVAADEPNARKHMELESVPNLQVDLLLTPRNLISSDFSSLPLFVKGSWH